VKVTGAELRQFYRDWPCGGDWFHDDGAADTDEADNLLVEPAVKYDLDEQIGFVAWQGEEDTPSCLAYKGQQVFVDRDGYLDLRKLFRLWRGDKRAVAVTLPTAEIDDLKTLAKERGWKIAT